MRVTAPQLILLILLVLLLFGANRLPSLAKNVGQSLKIFKKEMSDLTGDDRAPAATTPPAATAPQTPAAPQAPAPDPVTGTAPEAGTDVPPPPAPPRA